MFKYVTALALVLSTFGCSSGSSRDPSGDIEHAAAASSSEASDPVPVAPSGPEGKVGIKVTRKGHGAAIKSGQTAKVHYTGWLTNGKKFDSSRDRKTPFSFRLGAGEVIRGWDKGVEGMKVGERRKLTIPPDLGYGPDGSGPIPGNSTLIFDVELLAISK